MQKVVDLTGLASFSDGLGASSSEDDDVEKGVGSETICSVDRSARSLAGGEQSWDDGVLAVLVRDYLSVRVRNLCKKLWCIE